MLTPYSAADHLAAAEEGRAVHEHVMGVLEDYNLVAELAHWAEQWNFDVAIPGAEALVTPDAPEEAAQSEAPANLSD